MRRKPPPRDRRRSGACGHAHDVRAVRSPCSTIRRSASRRRLTGFLVCSNPIVVRLSYLRQIASQSTPAKNPQSLAQCGCADGGERGLEPPTPFMRNRNGKSQIEEKANEIAGFPCRYGFSLRCRRPLAFAFSSYFRPNCRTNCRTAPEVAAWFLIDDSRPVGRSDRLEGRLGGSMLLPRTWTL